MLSYLDAGTGSMILAAFAGGAAGIGVLVRLYWHRILGVFSKKHRAAAEDAARSLGADGGEDIDVVDVTDGVVDAGAADLSTSADT